MFPCVVSEALRRSFSAESPRPRKMSRRTSPRPARSSRSRSSRRSRGSRARGSPTCPPPRPCLRRRSSSATSWARPGELSRTSQIYGYFRALAEATPRVKVDVIGKSEEGREILLVAIADEEGIQSLDRLKAATADLADPRKTTPEARREDHRDGAADLLLQRRPALDRDRQPRDGHGAGVPAGRLGTADDQGHPQEPDRPDQPGLRAGRPGQDGRLVLPVPEGQDATTTTCRERSPPYWGHYVFHDNNRDTHQKALALTRAVHGMFYDYHPQVVHDLHESIPLLHTWNGTGPYNANLDPIAIGEWLETSFHEVQALTSPRHAGRLDLGIRRVWGLHYLDSVAIEPQLPGPRLRDLRQRHGGDRPAHAPARREALRRQARHRPGVVPAVAARQEVPLVAPQQHELHAERLCCPSSTGPRRTRRRCCAISTGRDTTPGRRA